MKQDQTHLSVRFVFHVLFALILLSAVAVSSPAVAQTQGRDSAVFANQLPNLTPFALDGWSAPLVLASVTGTNLSDALFEGQDTYTDWAITNTGAGFSSNYKTCIYYDGIQLNCWDSSGLEAGAIASQLDWVLTIPTTAGLHRVEIIADAENTVSESDESDNTWGFSFNWQPAEITSQGSGSPLAGDIRLRPDMGLLDAQSATGTSAPGYYNTTEYMINSVAVGIVMPESTGSGENWTTTERDQVVSEIQTGLNWWVQQASQKGMTLSFQYDIQYQIATSSEPITLSSSEDGTWIAQAMTTMGYTGATAFEQVYKYNNALRTQKGTSWAVTIFVVDSSNDIDGKFPNGYFGYAYLGGPYIVMTYDNDGWGISNMDQVTAHEMAHIFQAGDQYYEAGYGGCASTTELYGYLGIANSNCENNNPSADVNVIMNNNSWILHWTTAQQIGWRDSDSDGRMDPVDTAPGVNMSAYSPDPTSNTQLTYTGYAYDIPYPHHSCCGSTDITLNTISSVQYRVDAGAWTDASPVDGSFNKDYEQFTFTTPSLTSATHTIEVKVQNSVGATNATYWSDSVTVQGATPGAFNKTSPVSGATGQSTNPTLSWGTSSGAASYQYCYDTTNDSACSTWNSTSSASVALSGLAAGTTYYWQVRAVNGAGTTYANASSTSYWSFTTSLNAPGAFAKLSPTNGASGQATSLSISWETSSGATSYEYCYDISNDGACSTWTGNGTATSVSLSGLSVGTTYYWQVRATNASGSTYANGSATAYWSFATALIPPGAFGKGLPANAATEQSTSPTISWSASSNAASYQYCYDTTNDDACTSWVAAAGTSASLSGLSAGATYYWQVRAINATGSDTYADNGSYWSFSVALTSLPDLTVTNLHSIPSAGYTNENIYVGFDVNNTATTAAASFYIDVYVDHQPGGCGDYSDYYTSLSGLGANSVSQPWVAIPAGVLTAGTHTIWVKADSTCEIGESNENNNLAGPLSITISDPPVAPGHDDFSAARALSPLPYSDTVDVTGATVAADDPAATTCNLAPGLVSVWYQYTPASTVLLDIDTLGSDYDTYIAVWRGTRGALTLVGCNDDYNSGRQSALRLAALANTTYYIQVAEYNGLLASATMQSDREGKIGANSLVKSGGAPSELQAMANKTLSFHANTQPISSLKLQSGAAQDGWILESTETSSLGGTMNSTGTTILVGDAAGDKQYRGILFFNTAGLPDNAVIVSATLKLKRQSFVGTLPFTTHQGLKFDIRTPYFGTSSALATSDFQAAASQSLAGSFSSALISGWYSAPILSPATNYISRTGTTQFRIRFAKDDNDDNGADYLSFYSGNYATVLYRPTLVIEYYIP